MSKLMDEIFCTCLVFVHFNSLMFVTTVFSFKSRKKLKLSLRNSLKSFFFHFQIEAILSHRPLLLFWRSEAYSSKTLFAKRFCLFPFEKHLNDIFSLFHKPFEIHAGLPLVRFIYGNKRAFIQTKISVLLKNFNRNISHRKLFCKEVSHCIKWKHYKHACNYCQKEYIHSPKSKYVCEKLEWL